MLERFAKDGEAAASKERDDLAAKGYTLMRFVIYLGGLLQSASSVWLPLAGLSSVTGLCRPGTSQGHHFECGILDGPWNQAWTLYRLKKPAVVRLNGRQRSVPSAFSV